MKKLKIIGIFLFGLLSFVGISQRTSPAEKTISMQESHACFYLYCFFFHLEKRKIFLTKTKFFFLHRMCRV